MKTAVEANRLAAVVAVGAGAIFFGLGQPQDAMVAYVAACSSWLFDIAHSVRR